MKYLADENIEYSIIQLLKESDIDVLSVREIMKGATDSDIIKYALDNKLFIITSDKDFGELTFRLERPCCGIILIRFPETDSKEKAKKLLAALKKLDEINSVNKFIVIDRHKVRIRSLL